MAIFFRELGSTGNFFRGSRVQAHIFGDLGSPAKKPCLIIKNSSASLEIIVPNRFVVRF